MYIVSKASVLGNLEIRSIMVWSVKESSIDNKTRVLSALVSGITETIPPSHRDAGLEITTGTVQKYDRFHVPPNYVHSSNDEWQSKNEEKRVND